jgi:hypothetical protein
VPQPAVVRRARRAAAGGLALAAAACQAYTPISLASAPSADAVRVELTAAAAERLAPAVGPGVASLDGRVESVAGDTLRLAVAEAILRTGQAVEWRGERVSLAAADVAAVRRRRPSVVRSVLLGAAVAGGAALAATLVGRDGGEGRGRGGAPPPR